MTNVESMHAKAMELLERSEVARASKQVANAEALMLEAFKAECGAAEAIVDDEAMEPSRSIILKSAAILGLRSGRYLEAERWAAAALSGAKKPEWMAVELRSILRKISAHIHHQANAGSARIQDVLKMSLDGPRVGEGWISYAVLKGRMFSGAAMLQRTYDRKSSLPFQSSGRPRKLAVEPYVGAFASGSFVVELMLGPVGDPQDDLVADLLTSESIVEVVDCFILLQDGQLDALKERIGKDYFANFMALARDLVPDGHSVSRLDLVAQTKAGIRSVSITRAREFVAVSELIDSEPEKVSVVLSGLLRFANQLGDRHEVALEDEETGKKVATLIVPVELMDDIVRPRWGQRVRARVSAEARKDGSANLRKKVDFLGFENSPD